MRLHERIAFGTGSTTGIGAATAKRFVFESARVVVTGLHANSSADHAQRLNDLGRKSDAGAAIFLQADLQHRGDIGRLVDRTVDRWGRVDIFVDNAAFMVVSPIEGLSEEGWDRALPST